MTHLLLPGNYSIGSCNNSEPMRNKAIFQKRNDIRKGDEKGSRFCHERKKFVRGSFEKVRRIL